LTNLEGKDEHRSGSYTEKRGGYRLRSGEIVPFLKFMLLILMEQPMPAEIL
jgi:hypothetical protein